VAACEDASLDTPSRANTYCLVSPAVKLRAIGTERRVRARGAAWGAPCGARELLADALEMIALVKQGVTPLQRQCRLMRTQLASYPARSRAAAPTVFRFRSFTNDMKFTPTPPGRPCHASAPARVRPLHLLSSLPTHRSGAWLAAFRFLGFLHAVIAQLERRVAGEGRRAARSHLALSADGALSNMNCAHAAQGASANPPHPMPRVPRQHLFGRRRCG
jgi:hypothetical protein